jgi:hypothetical protein
VVEDMVSKKSVSPPTAASFKKQGIVTTAEKKGNRNIANMSLLTQEVN